MYMNLTVYINLGDIYVSICTFFHVNLYICAALYVYIYRCVLACICISFYINTVHPQHIKPPQQVFTYTA